MSHGDRVVSLPNDFFTVGSSENAPFAAIANQRKNFYGVQFHPEVVHTPDGASLLRNFTHKIANISPNWTMARFRDEAIRKIRDQVGSRKVICGLSGGVDSSVAAVLIHEAVGEQLNCVFVDHGLLRKGEAEQVIRVFRENYKIPRIDVNASVSREIKWYYRPGRKKKIIGAIFIEVFEAEAKLGKVEFLAQGFT